jgi:transposase InsO family protein
MRCQFIKLNAHVWPVVVQCDVLRVTRSAYYRWLKCPTSARTFADDRLAEEIKAIFETSQKTYGSKRIKPALRERNEICSRRRISRIMRNAGLFAKQRRKFVTTTDSKHDLPVADNLLNRQFDCDEINCVWTSDITYVPTAEGWLYLAAILDLGSRRIVSWAMSDRIDSDLVCAALNSAVANRHPAKGLLLHSDRGCQYASHKYRELLAGHGIIQSMSRKGNCWDNAPMESFFHSLKVEWLHGSRFKTRAEAKTRIFEYIEVWYNRKRLHSALNYQSPSSYEMRLAV